MSGKKTNTKDNQPQSTLASVDLDALSRHVAASVCHKIEVYSLEIEQAIADNISRLIVKHGADAVLDILSDAAKWSEQ
jgi:hypothetical protein|tara:strand:+ start:760 stop:993 length:234 start_codon:yes stop_codon:yes gene_type:complete